MLKSNLFKFGVAILLAVFTFNVQSFAQCSSSKKSHKAYRTSHHQKSSQKSNDLIGLAASSDNLSTLVAAVKAAGLVETLQGSTFTVFAPTNEAFAALPKGTIESLLKPENKDKLVKVLTYHVVPGRIESTDLRNGQKVASVQGQKINIGINGETVTIDNAIVRQANVRATNGVVHVIDRVILPKGL